MATEPTSDFSNLQAQLEAASFPEPQRAERLLLSLAKTDEERTALHRVVEALIHDLNEAPDAALSLLNLTNVADKVPSRRAFLEELGQQPAFRERLSRVLSWSQALADTLAKRPELLDVVRNAPQEISRPQLRQMARDVVKARETEKEKVDALRRFRREQTLRIGLIDMESHTERDEDDFGRVVRAISDLAQVCVEATLEVLEGGTKAPFCVIGMGKLGARELNYSSDIDLVFLHDGDNAAMNLLGERLLKALGDNSPEGAMFRVDMRLRPDGQSGTLVTPLAYALSYYESYAGAWEWQAMIKARVIAGDARLGRRFRKFVRGITWARRADDAHLREVVDMKRRSEATPEGRDPANVKQGPGSIRDAEWVVQQLQMMIGPTHKRARVKSTLRALKALHDFGALTFDEARDLRDGYLFLRVLEHRLQLRDERAIRVVPKDVKEQAALARRMEFVGRGEAVARRLDEELQHHRAAIRDLCERLFWGWRDAGQHEESDGATPLAGFSPDAARRLQRLAEGTQTRPLPAPLTRQIRAVMPEALRYVEHAADPERAIANLESLCEASGNRLSLLRSLAGSPHLARAVYSILGGSQRLSDTLVQFPQLLDLAAQPTLLARAKSSDEARADARDYVLAFRDRMAAMRRWRAREVVRIGLRDLVHDASPVEVTREIADLAASCIALGVTEVGAELRPSSENVAFSVLGMGKLGGGEMHYASDADVIFVYDAPGLDGEQHAPLATTWAEKLMRWVGERTAEGPGFELDARLRPEGASGALVRTVQSYRDYFEREVGGLAVWERQALTRSRFVAGDAATAARLQAAIRHVAFPERWQPQWSDELRHMKGRVENERGAKSRGSDVFDVKLGPGALSDIEWTAQWLAMKHGAAHTILQTPNTLQQIQAAAHAQVLDEAAADTLRDTYLFLRRAELRLQITQEHVSGVVKRGSKEFVTWSRALFPDESSSVAQERFEDEWRTKTRAVRGIFERVRDGL